MEPNTLEQRQPEKPQTAASPIATSSAIRFLVPLGLLIAAAIPFLFSIHSDFVYDDDAQIVHNQAIRTWHGVASYILPAAISKDAPATINGNYYRPLFYVWLRLNYLVFGLNSSAWHIANLLLHLGVTLLVFLLLRRHYPGVAAPANACAPRRAGLPWLAAGGALLFAIHPVHVESVVWLSGATDPLAALGLLGALLLWMRPAAPSRILCRGAALLCYAAALLAKETSIVLPVIIFMYVLLGIGSFEGAITDEKHGSHPNRFWAAVREAIPFVAVSILYLAARMAVLHRFRAGTPWISGWQAVLTIPRLLVFYLSHLLWPAYLSLFYDLRPATGIASAGFWLPMLVLAAVGGGAWFIWKQQKNNVVPVALTWFLVPLLPVLDIALFQREDFAHDRYLYLPVIALAIAAPALLEWAVRRFLSSRASFSEAAAINCWPTNPADRRFLLAGLTLFFVLVAASTAAQAQFWSDDLALYTHAMERSRNTGARNNLASLYARMGRTAEADAMLAQLIKEQPDSWLVNYNFGFVNYQEKRFDLAEQYLHHAIALDPSDASQYTYLGLTYLRESRYDESMTQLRMALQHDPSAEGCHLALGLMLKGRGDLQGARSEFVQEMDHHPGLVAANQLSEVSRAIAAGSTASH